MNDKREIKKIKGLLNPFVTICPVCGYSFKSRDIGVLKSKPLCCPMCGHTFYSPNSLKKEYY